MSPFTDSVHFGFGVDDHTNFEIHEKAAQIAIGGAEDSDAIIDDRSFAMQHAEGEKLHLHSGSPKLAHMMFAGEISDRVIGFGG